MDLKQETYGTRTPAKFVIKKNMCRAVVGTVNLRSEAWGKALESLQFFVTAVPQMA